MTPTARHQGSRAVLIGVAHYTHPDIPEISAATTNVVDLAQVLTTPEGGAFDPEYCLTITDPDRNTQIGEVIGRAAHEATDVLLVYYAGHGMLDRRGRLHLALTGSDPDHLAWTSIPFATLREEILASRARARVLILDCCFSGSAFEAMSDGPGLVTGQVDIHGTYTITSSGANDPSFAPEGHRNTAFTASMLAAAAETPGLTLDELYRHTEQHLRRQGHPLPQRRSIAIAGDLRLFGRIQQDEPEYQRSTDSDDVDAMAALALQLAERGEPAEAETLYRRAAEAGHTDGMYGLGCALTVRGEVAEAETLYRRAAEAGHTKAMMALALQLDKRGEPAEAETWWRKAAEAGHPSAVDILVALLRLRGEYTEAKTWDSKRS